MAINLSIIIINFNTSDYLDQCIQSIVQSMPSEEFEIIVVDNASTDGHGEMVKGKYPAINWIQNEKNMGFVSANNQAITKARGKYLLFLNPDTEILDNGLETLLDYLKNNSHVGVVGPQLLNSDRSFQHSYFSFPSFTSIFIEHVLSARIVKWVEHPKPRSLFPLPVDVIRGACLMTRESLIERIGGMNEKMFMYSEETDLCYKIHNLQYSVQYIPAAQVIHHERKSMEKQPNSFVSYHYIRSKVLFLKDNYPPLKAKLLVGLIKISLLVKLIIFRIFGDHQKADYLASLKIQLEKEQL